MAHFVTGSRCFWHLVCNLHKSIHLTKWHAGCSDLNLNGSACEWGGLSIMINTSRSIRLYRRPIGLNRHAWRHEASAESINRSIMTLSLPLVHRFNNWCTRSTANRSRIITTNKKLRYCRGTARRALSIAGCGQKNTLLQKFHYFQNNLIFFGQLFRDYSGGILLLVL